MIEGLDDISKRLIEKYEPDRIILFGSRAEETPSEGSDIDLLIVKETEKQPLDRQIEVETLLADRVVPVDIRVYTPYEIRELYSIGSPFIEEIMEKGRLLYMRKATSAWISDAEEEFQSARVLYEHERYRASCYHSQQSVEKGLKAMIIEKGKKPERTHDIVELYNSVKQMGFDPGLEIEDVVYLNSVYKGRYPTEEGLLPHGEPSKADTERALLSAGRLIRKLQSLDGDK